MEQVKSKRIAPALTLMFLAPLLTEVLPGATRFSSIFVFPIEMCVWGGGAVLIRYAVRRWQLGWLNMLLLAIALSLSEECIIQQTSLAPMVIQLKGVTYARFMGVNYVYLLWALVYEPVFVVFLPVYLAELIFPANREGTWVGKAGLVILICLFFLGSLLAWFSWTQIARPKFFHVPAYHPPVFAVVMALALIAGLIFTAIGPFKHKLQSRASSAKLPSGWVVGIAGALWATLWYGLVLLGFGLAPFFPPLAAIGGGLLLTVAILGFVPRWVANAGWSETQAYALIFGTMLGSMLVSFLGFIGSAPADFTFKLIIDIVAFLLLIRLGLWIKRRS